jgi:hypothetical protein
MMAAPRMTCGQNIPAKSVCGVWNALIANPTAKSAKPIAVKETRFDSLLQPNRNPRRKQLREAGHQHDRPDLQGVVAADKGQIDRHEIERPKKSDPENKTQGAPHHEAAVGEIAKVDERRRVAQRSHGESDGACDAESEQH